MTERIKIVLILCATAIIITILTIYFSPYQSCVRAGANTPNPNYVRMSCAIRH